MEWSIRSKEHNKSRLFSLLLKWFAVSNKHRLTLSCKRNKMMSYSMMELYREPEWS